MHHVSSSIQLARGKAAPPRAGRPLLLFAVAYVAAWSYLFIAAFLGAKPPPAPLFPPGAVLLCALLLSPSRHWWQFLAVACVIQVPILAYVHVPPLWAVLGFIPDAVEPVIAVTLIRRYLPLPLRFASLHEVSVYAACVATAVLVDATLGSAVNAVLGGEPYWTTWVGWYLGDILACLVLAPTLLLWSTAGAVGTGGSRATFRWRYTEAALLYGGLLLLGVVVFNTQLLGPEMADALIYLPVPLLLWAAVRFGPRGIASALALTAGLAVPAVANARGPFASQSAPAVATLGNVFTLQVFLLAVGVPLFFLAALMQENGETNVTLQESEARFRIMANQAPVLIWMSGADALCTFFNTVWLTFTGRSLEQELGNGWAEGVHPDDYERCLQTYLAAFHARRRSTMEYRLRRFDGEYRWLVDSAVPRFAADGSFVGYIGSAVDITDRKQAEEALRASEERYQAVVETQTEMITRYRPDTTLTFVNDATCRYWGKSREELLGWAFLPTLPETAATRVREMIAALLAQPDPGIVTIEYEARAADGSSRWQQWVNRTILDADGQVVELQGIGRDITERKRAEEALQANEERYRDLVESQTEMVCRYLPDSTLTFVNEAFCRCYGRPRDALIGTKFLDGMDLPGRIHHSEHLTALLVQPHTTIDEHRITLPDGSIGWQQWVDHPIFDADGQLVEIQAIGRDVTERKRAEAALRESEARFRAAFESAAVGMALVGLDGHPLELNHALVQMLGYSEAEMRTHAFAEVTLPEDVEPNLTLFQQAVAGDLEHYHVEKRYLHKDGHLVWAHLSAGVVRDAVGKPLYLVAHQQDISERKRAEEALRASEARYRTVVRNLPQTVVLLFDAQLRHTFAEGPGLEALGLTPEGLEGRTVWETLPGDLAAALAPQYEAARSGQAAEMDVEHAQHIYRIQVVPMPTAPMPAMPAMPANMTATAPAQTPVGMVVLRDITEQRRARDELVRERTRADLLGSLSQEFRTLAEHSPDLIARFDPVGRFVYVNQAGADRLGLPAEHWVGKTFADLGIDRAVFAPWAQALRDVVQTRERCIFDIEVQAPDGLIRSVHVRFIPEFADDECTLLSVLAIATDISALKQAEARLAEQASELQAIFAAQADVVVVYDKDRRFVRGNRAWEEFHQRSIAMRELGNQPAFNALSLADQVDWLKGDIRDEHGRLIPVEERPTARALRGEIITGSNAVDERFQSADGQDVQISVTAAPIRDHAGQIAGAVLVGRDVTARRQLERQVTEQASELEAIFEAKADGMAVYDLQGRFVRANSALRQLLGFDADREYTARPLDERAERLLFFDEHGQPLTAEQWPQWRVLRGEILTGASAMEGRVRTVDGRELWISTTGAPVRRPDGQVTGMVLMTRDVTARRALESQVQDQASQLEAIFEAMADGVLVHDAQGCVLQVNQAYRHLVGAEADPDYFIRSLVDRGHKLQVVDEHGQPIPEEHWASRRVLRGEVMSGQRTTDMQMHTLDGRDVWVNMSGAPIRAPDGEITGAVLISRDVTARRALERQAAEQAAAAERTRLAHELHDTVTQDIYSAGLLADSITRNWQEHRAEAEQALAQLPEVIRSALAGLRVLLLELRPTALDHMPLAALLHQLGEAMSTRAKVPIAVRIQVNGSDVVHKAAEPPLPPEVKLVFYRVAQEALMNAVKYARARAIRVQLRTRGRGRDKGTIKLEIADDGQGFDPSAIPGGHFGLAMMRERTQAVGATVQVHSQLGQGTQIVVAWQGGTSGYGPPPEGGNS